MDYDALTAAQRRTYLEVVSRTHHRRIEVDLLDLDGNLVRSFDDDFLGGDIQGDAKRTPAEVLTVQLLDESGTVDWAHGRHRQYQVRIADSRFIPELDEWVRAVVFTGPLWDFDREGSVVTLVAQGSERLAMGSLRNVFTRPRKSRATAVIRDLLVAAGAKNPSIPKLKARLPESVTIGVRRGKRVDTNGKKDGKGKDNRPVSRILRATLEETYWSTAEEIAHALDRDIFPDGRGRFLMRAPQSRPSLLLDSTMLLGPVTEQRPDDGETPNTWLVVGADPKGPKKRVQVEVRLSPKHPLSRESLAWNGKPREVTVRIENKHLRTKAQALALGRRRRDRAMRELTTYEVEALPVIPWVRPRALLSIPVGVGGSSGRASMRVTSWTLPLGPTADPLVLGANRGGRWRGRHGHGGVRHDIKVLGGERHGIRIVRGG